VGHPADDPIETAVSDPLRRFPLCLISLVLVALISFSEAALAQNYRAPRKDRHPRQPQSGGKQGGNLAAQHFQV
jgi:hypothetical protein